MEKRAADIRDGGWGTRLKGTFILKPHSNLPHPHVHGEPQESPLVAWLRPPVWRPSGCLRLIWWPKFQCAVTLPTKTHGQARQQATRNVSRLPCARVPWASQSSAHPISCGANGFLFGNELLACSSLYTCNSPSAFSTDTQWGHRSLWTWATAQKRHVDLHTGVNCHCYGNVAGQG